MVGSLIDWDMGGGRVNCARDTKQGPPRSEGVVPWGKRRSRSGGAYACAEEIAERSVEAGLVVPGDHVAGVGHAHMLGLGCQALPLGHVDASSSGSMEDVSRSVCKEYAQCLRKLLIKTCYSF